MVVYYKRRLHRSYNAKLINHDYKSSESKGRVAGMGARFDKKEKSDGAAVFVNGLGGTSLPGRFV